MKRLEGWDIELPKNIRSSVAKKTFLIIMALLVTCGIVIYCLIMYFLPNNYQTKLEGQFAIGFQELVQALKSDGIEYNAQLLYEFSLKNNAIVTIKDSEGKELFSVKTDDDGGKKKEEKTYSTSAQFVYKQEEFLISATASFIAVSQTYDVLLNLIPLIMIMMVVISLVGAYIFANYFCKPLIEICSVAKRMTQLDMTWKCDTDREDEIGVLADSLNEMSARLDTALNSLKTANEQLKCDIEKERQQEQQRIDFFTSVSHELKTPITVIKGELEGMIYNVGEYKNRDLYLRHALKRVEDMEKLVKEILLASRIGGENFYISSTNLNISEMMKEVCRTIEGMAEEKGITIYKELESDFYYRGNESLLRKVLSNIVGNAVIYSPQNERVVVSLEDGILSILNTGIHIKEEDLEQVFIPFYRVDKSRNRNTGGSGLGLYIVKTILEHYNIFYYMENIKEGIQFIIDFNKNNL